MDVTSMYPYIMIMLNMSLETYYGCILNLSEQEIIFNIRRGYFDEFILEKNEQMIKISENSLKQFNKDLKNKKYSIAPNGAVFSNEKDGVVKIIEKTFFKIRKNTKAQMLELKKNNGDKNLIQQLNTTQLAIKVGVLNSLYGSLSTPYFRLYNLKIAEAITSCGRYILKTCMNEINNFLNNKTDTDSQVIDFITYMDTDSMFVCLNKLYENNEKYKKYFNNLDFNKKIDFSLKVFKQIEEYINNFSYKQIQQIDFNSNETDFKLNWKQEIIAPSILHVEKKKYGY
jgi:DNA polymerase elongation subunit (family B)